MIKSFFIQVRALQHILLALTMISAKNNACSCIGCRLVYANAILVGVSRQNLKCLQHIQNTLARVVTCQHSCISLSSMLKELHWLPVSWWIEYKDATMTYNYSSPMSRHVYDPELRSRFHDTPWDLLPTIDVSRNIHRTLTLELGLFVVLPQPSGMHCRTTSEALNPSPSLEGADLKHTIPS